MTAEVQQRSLGFNVAEINPHKRLARIFHMARIAQGKTRQQLGEELNVSGETIRRWEVGECAIDVVTLRAAAVKLNQDVNLFWS